MKCSDLIRVLNSSLNKNTLSHNVHVCLSALRLVCTFRGDLVVHVTRYLLWHVARAADTDRF